MKPIFLFIFISILFISCNSTTKSDWEMNQQSNIIFLHHSTGKNIWRGNTSRLFYKILKTGSVQKFFNSYNNKNEKAYTIEEMYYPNNKGGYGWKNYPYDYYNLWVKKGRGQYFMHEPTLETLTKKYNVIIWKHCFPVSDILPDTGHGDINSEEKRIENYKLQYQALKQKMLSFQNTKFIVWTGAALTQSRTNPEKAQRAKEFFYWVKSVWDTPGDNIFLWDFYELETEGELYLKNKYASGINDPHPSKNFSATVAPLFCQRIIDVIEGRGDSSSLTGK